MSKPQTYHVRRLTAAECDRWHFDPDRTWWGVFTTAYPDPAHISATDGDALLWVRRMGGTAIVEKWDRPVEPLPESVKTDAPVGLCDRCRAAAYVELVNGADVLTFCLHHHRDNAAALTAAGYSVLRDARHLLTF